jgi:glycosyltransferase involved in cell wall biosynthesis
LDCQFRRLHQGCGDKTYHIFRRKAALIWLRGLSSFHFHFKESLHGMRILYILTSLGVGGAESQALSLAARMRDRGHSVRVLALRQQLPEEWPTSLPVEYLGLRKSSWPLLNFFKCLFMGAGCVRRFRPDLMHGHGFHANMAARLLRLVSPGTKLVCSIHNVYEGGRLRMLAYRFTSLLADRTIAVSQAVRQSFVGARAVEPSRCVVVPNGIDTDEFAPRVERRACMRMEMGANGDFVWLAAGRIAPAKDYPNLLRAFSRLRIVRSDVRLWIAAETGGDEFQRAKMLIVELGLQDFVRWLGLRRDMPALFDAADGLVLSSAWEGMPLVVGEAMAMEKLVVATDVGGVRELLGETGLIVPQSAPRALAGAMLEAMQMPATERRVRGSAARRRIAAGFSLESAADRWEAVYKAIL